MNPIQQYADYVNPTLIKLFGIFGYGRVYTRAEDVWMWDQEGRQYLDFLAGFGSVNLGHNPPRLMQHIQSFFATQPLNLSHVGPGIHTASLASVLAQKVSPPLQISLFSNSGAEAVEAGMKLAQAYTKRTGFLYCTKGFHGTNYGALSIMGEKRMRAPFEPLLRSCQAIPFGNLDALKQQLETKQFAAFVVEPIQGEGGVLLPPEGYLKNAQELCQRYKTLLILDEVQTGLGRTGTFFAYENEQMVPDILVLAKALSGSIAPIGVTITSKSIFQKAYGSMDRFDLHSSTFGGNAFSCTVAEKTIQLIEEEGLILNSQTLGSLLKNLLQARLAKHPWIKEIRGRGLFVAIELGANGEKKLDAFAPWVSNAIAKHLFGQWLAFQLLEKGLICQPASHAWNTLKLVPPLTIQEKEIRHAVHLIGEVFDQAQAFLPVLQKVLTRLRVQYKKGWSLE